MNSATGGKHCWRLQQIGLVMVILCTQRLSNGQSTEFGLGQQLASFRSGSQNSQQLLLDLSATRAAIAKNSPASANYLRLGRDLKALGEADAALKQFDHALEVNPKLPEALFERGSVLADQGKWTEAEDFFQRAIAASPGYAEAHIGLAEMCLRTGNFELARKELDSALRLDPKSASAYQGLGLIDLQESHIEDAEKDFVHALAIRPHYTDAQRMLARSLIAQHKSKEAAELLQGVVEENPNSTQDVFSFATALEMFGNKAAAQEQFARARELSRRETTMLRAKGENNSGIALRSEGKLLEAAAAFRQAIAQDGDFCEGHDNLGGVLWLTNDPAGALGEFELALKCDPNSASSRNNFGSALLYYRHDLDDAVQQFRSAVSLRPGFALGHSNLGKCLAAKQDLADAESEFRQAIAIDPDMAIAHVELGLLLAMHNGRVSSEAGAEMKIGIQLDPKLRSGIPAEYLAQLQ